jgi:hypothetical protein
VVEQLTGSPGEPTSILSTSPGVTASVAVTEAPSPPVGVRIQPKTRPSSTLPVIAPPLAPTAVTVMLDTPAGTVNELGCVSCGAPEYETVADVSDCSAPATTGTITRQTASTVAGTATRPLPVGRTAYPAPPRNRTTDLPFISFVSLPFLDQK